MNLDYSIGGDHPSLDEIKDLFFDVARGSGRPIVSALVQVGRHDSTLNPDARWVKATRRNRSGALYSQNTWRSTAALPRGSPVTRAPSCSGHPNLALESDSEG